MYKHGVGDFKYFVGTSSLAHVATREDRVCAVSYTHLTLPTILRV